MPYKRIVIDGVRHYGKHVILTASGCNAALLEKVKIADFCRDMVKRIDMVAFGEPFVERFGDGDEVGISAVQLIQTSAITIHTNDEARDMYLDVFSCKDFEADAVVQAVKDWFAPAGIESQTLLRK
ncbi:MAG: S-adenosylmethionine decarboxylase [Alphaproteobacteria bacterium]|nr:S-adenosylmethionine decarboxylase [Alphaproteobacteria bacterium]MCB9931216.1 S-adenosylmethionine decarboxylase [Alphaproteobacteria bacterium]